MPEISQSPLSDRTQQVEHWGCGCVPIVLASDDMQASAVEAASLQQSMSMPRKNVSMWNTSPQFQCPRKSVVGPDVRQ